MATHVGIFSMKSHHFNRILFYNLEDVLIVITKITQQIVISSTSVDQNWFVRNHIKRLKHYALYLILLKYKIYILGRTQMSIIMVTMPHNFGRGFIIITFIYAKNILAKVSRVLSLDNLVICFRVGISQVYRHIYFGGYVKGTNSCNNSNFMLFRENIYYTINRTTVMTKIRPYSKMKRSIEEPLETSIPTYSYLFS